MRDEMYSPAYGVGIHGQPNPYHNRAPPIAPPIQEAGDAKQPTVNLIAYGAGGPQQVAYLSRFLLLCGQPVATIKPV